MRRLLPYLKPYISRIILALALVVVMASANLALPDYLSRIVNVGIQQNGIDQTVPSVVRASFMDQMALFQSAADHAQVLNAYTLVNPGTPEAAALAVDYPAAATEPVYELKPADAATLSNLSALMAKPLVILSGINQLQQDPTQANTLLGPDFARQLGSLPPGTDLLKAIQSLPQATRDQLQAQIDSYLNALQGTTLDQVVIRALAAEYSALAVNLENRHTSYIMSQGGIMLLLSLLSVVTSLSVSYLASRVSAGFARDVRSAIFKKVESFSTAEFDNFSTASLITRTTNDVAQVQLVVFMIIRMAFTAPLTGGIGIIRALQKGPSMWWIIALGVGLLILMVMVIFTIVSPKFAIIQKLIDRINLVMRENLSGTLVVRAFNKQGFEEKRFDQANLDLSKTQRSVGRTFAFIFPLINVILTGVNVLIIWIGAHEIAQSALRVGDLIAFMQYALQIISAFLNLSILFIFLPRAAVSGDRIADVLEEPVQIQDPANPREFAKPVRGLIAFEDVDFRYPGAEEDVLHDISFTARPGTVTTVIGSTGSGKSTLINLVPRFYEVSKGSIKLDGIDIRDVTQKELRDQIGYAPQRGMLFSGTIASNLQMAKPDATEEEMRKAIEIAQATDFVDANPAGLDYEISQGGINVSGGQKQRISIARAIVKKPPIYVFDDSFSALDFKTDAALRQALAENVKDSTVLIVTQRVATAMNSDQIIVLDKGRIAGIGSHKELMKTSTTYQEIASSQLSQEELA